jgi:hypothetical protein
LTPIGPPDEVHVQFDPTSPISHRFALKRNDLPLTPDTRRVPMRNELPGSCSSQPNRTSGSCRGR